VAVRSENQQAKIAAKNSERKKKKMKAGEK